MSVTFCWDLVKTDRRTFAHGTSNDTEVLKRIAPNGVLSTNDLQTLRAMHAATHQLDSLWSDIARVLESLQGDNVEKTISIKVWPEY